MKKNRIALLFVLSITCVSVMPQRIFTTVKDGAVKTLQIKNDQEERLIRPILELGGSDVLTVSFDELSHNVRNFSYTLHHCNADWSISTLHTNEFVSGFTTADITNYSFSENTTQLYINYRFSFPNSEMTPKISGNYAIRIYEDGDQEKVVAWACFSIVEPRILIDTKCRSNTDIELHKRYQQLDIYVTTAGYTVRDPMGELQVVVRQNNRTDNEVVVHKPTYINGDKLSYVNNKALIFEGGNEFRRFDISSVYIIDRDVERMEYDRINYHAQLYPYAPYTQYQSAFDANGQFIVNRENAFDDSVEADYVWVHFVYPIEAPYFDGTLYIGGEFNHNQLNPLTRMEYDSKTKSYHFTQQLKQGGYNYQYWFLPKGAKQATLQRTEGSFWQTSNEYTIYVYHRPFGERYDRLVGFKSISSDL